jgi:hypothetical protein
MWVCPLKRWAFVLSRRQRLTVLRQGSQTRDQDCGRARGALTRCVAVQEVVGIARWTTSGRSVAPVERSRRFAGVRDGERLLLAPLDPASGSTCEPWFLLVRYPSTSVTAGPLPGRGRAQRAVSWFGSVGPEPATERLPQVAPNSTGPDGTLCLTRTDTS